MNFNGVLIAYGLIVVFGRFLGGRASTASWEVVLTVAIGIAWGLQPVERPGHKPALTAASFLAFPLVVAMLLVARDLFVLLPSVTFIVYGVRGLVNGRIIVAGRVGPGREFRGAAAYFRSTLCILFGAFMITLGLLVPGFWRG